MRWYAIDTYERDPSLVMEVETALHSYFGSNVERTESNRWMRVEVTEGMSSWLDEYWEEEDYCSSILLMLRNYFGIDVTTWNVVEGTCSQHSAAQNQEFDY
jgi:hypothetical protein